MNRLVPLMMAIIVGVVVGFTAHLGTGVLVSDAFNNGWIAMPTQTTGTPTSFILMGVSVKALTYALACGASLGCHGALTRLFARLREAREDRLRKKGLCVHCRYSLEGNVSGVCPECGETI